MRKPWTRRNAIPSRVSALAPRSHADLPDHLLTSLVVESLWMEAGIRNCSLGSRLRPAVQNKPSILSVMSVMSDNIAQI